MSRIVVEALAQKDPAEAFAWVRDQPDTNVDRNAIVNLAHRWSESDPNAAVAAFAKLQDKPWSQQPLQWTLHALAEHDPELAKQWIGRMPTAQTQAFATRAVASGLARIDPEEALAWSQTLNGDMRDESLAGVVSGFSDNPQRQYDIAQTIQDETIKSAALRIAIFSMGGRDVARATQWLESSSFDDFQREELRRYLEQQ